MFDVCYFNYNLGAKIDDNYILSKLFLFKIGFRENNIKKSLTNSVLWANMVSYEQSPIFCTQYISVYVH